MDDCRAAVITAHNEPLEIQRVPIPELEPGSLLVKITASTLCGTDVQRWHGPLGGRPCRHVLASSAYRCRARERGVEGRARPDKLSVFGDGAGYRGRKGKQRRGVRFRSWGWLVERCKPVCTEQSRAYAYSKGRPVL